MTENAKHKLVCTVFAKVKTNEGMLLKYLRAVWDKAVDQSVTVTEESVEL